MTRNLRKNSRRSTRQTTCLATPKKGKKYDDLGENWQYHQQAAGSNDYYNQSRTGGRQGGYQYSSGDESQFSDFFESIFGNGGGFGNSRQRRNTQTKGEDYQSETTITLEEAFHGTTRQVNLQQQKLNLKLKPGIAEGQILRMKGKGGPGMNGGPDGDLFITVHVQPHGRFIRKGNDLYTDQPLDAFTAILGGKLPVEAIDKTLNINIPAGTDSDKTFRLKDMGMPDYNNPGTRGDCYVRVSIIVPKNLTEQEKEELTRIANAKK